MYTRQITGITTVCMVAFAHKMTQYALNVNVHVHVHLVCYRQCMYMYMYMQVYNSYMYLQTFLSHWQNTHHAHYTHVHGDPFILQWSDVIQCHMCMFVLQEDLNMSFLIYVRQD